MNKTGGKYLLGLFIILAMMFALPTKPVLALGCGNCDCNPPPPGLDCELDQGDPCNIDSDCGSEQCLSNGMCGGSGGGGGGSAPYCPWAPYGMYIDYANPTEIVPPIEYGALGYPLYCGRYDDDICAYVVYQYFPCVAYPPPCQSTGAEAVTLLSPENDDAFTTTNVGLMWDSISDWGNSCSGDLKYYIIWTRDITTNPDSAWDWDRGAGLSVAGNNGEGYGWVWSSGPRMLEHATFRNGIKGHKYEWGVVAYHDGGSGAGTNGTTWGGSRTFRILDDQIEGQVFYDPNNNCTGTTGLSGSSVSLNGGAGQATASDGTFSVTGVVGASHTLAVSMPVGYACSTSALCNTCARAGIGAPSQNNKFYLTDLLEPWWQTEGAGIYAGGQVRSTLPDASTRLIVAPIGGTAAALLQATGTTGLGNGTVSDPGWVAKTKYKGKTMGYSYFSAHLGLVKGIPSDWVSDTIDKPTYDDTKEFLFSNPLSGTSTIGTAWTVPSGEKYTVMVNGDLRINNDITVAPGGFLAFIVNGKITINPSVASLQGLYVSDENFITETKYVLNSVSDVQLNMQGSVITWGALSLTRNLGIGNFGTPAEKFTYRADLIENMPPKMKNFAMQWQEVVAGSFDN